MPSEKIYVNSNSQSLSNSRVLSSTSDQSVGFKNFVIADKLELEIFVVDGLGAYVDISGYSAVRVGVGGLNKTPTGGTFSLTGGLSLQSIAYNADASAMDSAITSAQACAISMCSFCVPLAPRSSI